jgi:hypothetical protein
LLPVTCSSCVTAQRPYRAERLTPVMIVSGVDGLGGVQSGASSCHMRGSVSHTYRRIAAADCDQWLKPTGWPKRLDANPTHPAGDGPSDLSSRAIELDLSTDATLDHPRSDGGTLTTS